MFRFQTGFRAPVIVSRDGGMKARSPSQSFHGADDYGSPQGMLGWQDSPAPVLSALQESSLCPGSHGPCGFPGREAMRVTVKEASREVRCTHGGGNKKRKLSQAEQKGSRNSQKQMQNCAVDHTA